MMAEKIERKDLRCTSCNVNIGARANFVSFSCPSCGKELIVRCNNCKEASSRYICKSCGFEGP